MEKILHISKYYYPFTGGTEQVARECVLALKNRYDQKVIAFSSGKNSQTSTVDGVEIIECGTFAKASSQPLSKPYWKIFNLVLARYKPDIIIFHYPNPFVASILLKALKRHNNIDTKLIIYWHLDIVKQKVLKYFFASQNKKLLERANKVIATSPNYIEGSSWLKSVKHKCVVIPNCINLERMKLSQKIKDRADEIRKENIGKTICIAVGRHTQYKGFKYLIQASKMLDDSFRFFITGTGELTEKLRREAQGDSKVKFTGRVDDEELKALIYASDIFCFPSITKNEAFGLALAEAMYYEKPAVTFKIPGSGVNYVCLDGENGIEVENRNVKQYAKALKKFAENETLRKQYGKAGRKRVVENFLSTQYWENVVRLINEI